MPKPARAPAEKPPAALPVEQPGRPVKYPKVKAVVHDEDNPLTVREAMKILGWEAEKGDVRFGSDFLFLDRLGNKVRCVNNPINRPFYENNAGRLMQDMLNDRWELNGETVIVGKTGLLLNGQHSLVALIWAEQERLYGKDKEYWTTIWPGEVTIRKVVVYGIDEGDATVNSMDTAKPRSFADVIYRSPYFAAMKQSERRQAANMCDAAVRVMWDRTHAGADAHSPTRTFAEGLAFLDRHPRLLEAIRHIQTEIGTDKDKTARLMVGPGTAAALMYLMAASGSDAAKYRADRKETSLDLSRWDRAEEFWTLLAAESKELNELRRAFSFAAENGAGGRRPEYTALIVRAWTDYWQPGKPLVLPSYWDAKVPIPGLRLQYRVDKNDGTRTLLECPILGGVDFGTQEEPVSPADAEPGAADAPLGPDDDEGLEAGKAEVLKARDAAAARKGPSKVAAGPGRPVLAADSFKQTMARLKFQTDGRVLFFRTGQGPLVLWESDAINYAKYLGRPVRQHKETALYQEVVQPWELEKAVKLVLDKGGKLSCAVTEHPELDGADRWEVENLEPGRIPVVTAPPSAETVPPAANGQVAAPPKPAPRPGSGPKPVGTRPPVKLRGGTGS